MYPHFKGPHIMDCSETAPQKEKPLLRPRNLLIALSMLALAGVAAEETYRIFDLPAIVPSAADQVRQQFQSFRNQFNETHSNPGQKREIAIKIAQCVAGELHAEVGIDDHSKLGPNADPDNAFYKLSKLARGQLSTEIATIHIEFGVAADAQSGVVKMNITPSSS